VEQAGRRLAAAGQEDAQIAAAKASSRSCTSGSSSRHCSVSRVELEMKIATLREQIEELESNR
jgi:hypothetical protein